MMGNTKGNAQTNIFSKKGKFNLKKFLQTELAVQFYSNKI